ncbi:MAG: SDR family oxidoreductase, partial [Dehalococcoidia bacterium]
RPEANIGTYAISKAGVIMVSKVMALELARYNIRVNTIAPGNVHTRLGDSRFLAMPEYEAEMVKRTPLRRIGEPDDMVGAMIYLASDASSFVTGECIIVGGGILLT